MQLKPKIRTIESKDVEVVYSIGKPFFAGPDKLDWGWTIEYVKFLSEYHTDTFFVAKMENKIVGFIVSKAPISSDKPLIGWLETMAVLPNYQKKGIGTLLINTAVKKLKEKGMKTIRLANWESKKELSSLYKKNQFYPLDKLTMRERKL